MSSIVNEVIRAVLNSFFFYEKILHSPKAPNAQRRSQVKGQNDTSEQKQKMRLKKIQGEKSHLFAYLRFCACKIFE